jgi:hypothetical protein
MHTVKLKLEGLNGNAFHLLGAFRIAAQEQGWSSKRISDVYSEAMAGDYAHLMATLARYTEPPTEEGEDDI